MPAVGRLAPGNLFDIQLAAGLIGLAYPLSHGSLVQQVLGITLTKGETLTEWRHRPLTPAQLHYAFDDVRHLLALWEHIADRLNRLNRNDWAREEFLRMQNSTDPEEMASEKWRRLRGLGSLDRRRLAIARALYQWREGQAERSNRPNRAILRDDLIIEIARRSPTRDRDLQVVRGLQRRDLDAILQVAVQARSLPLDQCPVQNEREQDPPQVGLVTSVLQAVLGDLCVRMELAPNLSATTQDIKALVRARLAGEGLPEESLLTEGCAASTCCRSCKPSWREGACCASPTSASRRRWSTARKRSGNRTARLRLAHAAAAPPRCRSGSRRSWSPGRMDARS